MFIDEPIPYQPTTRRLRRRGCIDVVVGVAVYLAFGVLLFAIVRAVVVAW